MVLIMLWRGIWIGRRMSAMAAAYRAVVAERKDIAVVTVVCGNCSSEVSINAETAPIPVACPSCGREYEGDITAALVSLGRFHKMAKVAEGKDSKTSFRFNIRQSD